MIVFEKQDRAVGLAYDFFRILKRPLRLDPKKVYRDLG